MTTKPNPYTSRPWQLPHLLATPVGGTVAGIRECRGQLALDVFEHMWLVDNPGAKWGDWAWFVTAERVER